MLCRTVEGRTICKRRLCKEYEAIVKMKKTQKDPYVNLEIELQLSLFLLTRFDYGYSLSL